MLASAGEIEGVKLILGSGNAIGTINVGNLTNGYLECPLEIAPTSVAGGNVISMNGVLLVDQPVTFDANGVLTKTGPAEIFFIKAVTCGAGSVYNDTGGTTDFELPISAPGNLIVNSSGTGWVGFSGISYVNTIHCFSGGIAGLPNGAHASLFTYNFTIDGGATPTGGFQVADNKLVVEATVSPNTVFANLQFEAKYGSTNLGRGIYDGFLPANYALAVMDNAVLGKATFGGIAVDANSILISRELLGDANADGHVDLTDLSTVLNHFGSATPNWTDGNFDNAPTIDLTDLSDVLNNFGLSNPNANLSPLSTKDSALSTSSPVPEPTSLTLFLPATLLLARRKHPPAA
jgi:hypothetical protein